MAGRRDKFFREQRAQKGRDHKASAPPRASSSPAVLGILGVVLNKITAASAQYTYHTGQAPNGPDNCGSVVTSANCLQGYVEQLSDVVATWYRRVSCTYYNGCPIVAQQTLKACVNSDLVAQSINDTLASTGASLGTSGAVCSFTSGVVGGFQVAGALKGLAPGACDTFQNIILDSILNCQGGNTWAAWKIALITTAGVAALVGGGIGAYAIGRACVNRGNSPCVP